MSKAVTEIERVGPQGEGIARVEERDLHVPGAFLGERVHAQITARSRQHPRMHGRLVHVLTPSPERRESPCPRAGLKPGRCGGCPWIELSEQGQLAHAAALLEDLGLKVDRVVASPEAFAYRRTSKRVAFTQAEALTLGSWSPRTHVGASMRGCRVDDPQITEAFDELEDTARRLGVRAYDEATKEGELRYVWAKRTERGVVLTLITADGDPAPLADALTVPVAVAHSRQPHDTNAIRGDAPALLRGEPDVDPLGFTQPNPALIDLAVSALIEADDAPVIGPLAWDLYAGSGAITARLRTHFDEVVPCERYPDSARSLGVEPIDVKTFLEAQTTPAPFVVANPPRKGLGGAVCDALARLRPPRLHVMSCGPGGLAKDRDRLLAAGYRQLSLEAFHSLPQTPHVELVLKLALA